MEVTPDLFKSLLVILKDFRGVYDEGVFFKRINAMCGQAVFINKKIEIKSNGKVSIYRQSSRDLGFMQFAEIGAGEKTLWLGSLHGKTLPGNKLDTPIRLKQSEKIINFFANKSSPKIIGGDFNLMPDTKSIELIEKAGYRNLIRDFNIQETRNRLSWEQFPEEQKQHFADYVFVSEDVKVNTFEAPPVEVSDHLPQILDFEV